MKKFLVFAMVLVSACMLFADNLTAPVDLAIYTTVTDSNQAAWGENEMTLDNWNIAKKLTDRPFSGPGTANSIVVYPSVLTNSPNAVKLTVTGEALSSTTAKNTTITIFAQKGDETNSVSWNEAGDTDSIVWTDDSATGRRVVSRKLTLTMDETTYGKALAANDYEATLTLTVEPASV